MAKVVVLEGVFVSVDVEEVSGEPGTVDVGVTCTTGAPGLEDATLLVVEVRSVGAVDVELTKGGAFSIYEPLG